MDTKSETAAGNEGPGKEKKEKKEKEPREIGGPKGPEPTRFGDWERNGRCTDF